MKYTVVGDRHNHRATVLVEDHGRKWIRKPGDAAIETALKVFLSNLEEKGFLFIPGTVCVIASYGTEYDIEFVEHTEAETEEDVHLFYKRCGSLLFLAYLFRSNDLHFENIVAHGAYPVIVDYETLLCGDSRRMGGQDPMSLSDTVIRSHLLPNWIRLGDQDVDLGGITGDGNNRLYWKGKPTDPAFYKSDIIAGFESAYHFCRENAGFVEEQLHVFDHCRFRRILRPTQLYMKLIAGSQKKDSGLRERWLRQLLSRAYLKDIDPDRIKKAFKVLEEEISAVLREEVPLFWTWGNGLALCCREEVMQADFLAVSPVDHAAGRLRALSERDCANQVKIISMAIDAVAPLQDFNYNIVSGEEDVYSLVISKLEETNIGQLASGWIGLERDAKDTLYLQSRGFGLYSGLLGILCCYAAVYYKTGRKDVLEKLLRHYEGYHRYAIPEKGELSLCDVLAGLNEGAGGHIKALFHLSELTGEDIFRRDAVRIADAVNLSEEWSEGSTDVLNGYAGLALALADLPSERAAAIGEKLLPILMKYEPALTGAAHGAGGIALALGILGKVLSTDLPDQKILDLLRWENSRYDREHHNWADLREPGRRAFMLGWCSGAPGIGMVRHRLMDISGNPEIKEICRVDTEKSYRIMRGYDVLRQDHLCCGNCARLMAVSNIGGRLDSLYREVEKRLKKDQPLLRHMIGTQDFHAGLMQGYAGIGYALAMYGDRKSGNMLV